jgi:hypothetical protein
MAIVMGLLQIQESFRNTRLRGKRVRTAQGSWCRGIIEPEPDGSESDTALRRSGFEKPIEQGRSFIGGSDFEPNRVGE